MNEIHLPKHRDEFESYLLNGNHRKATTLAHELVPSSLGIMGFYEGIIKPALYRVGDKWENNLITVAEEHTATSIAEAVMNELYALVLSREIGERKVVLGCVENEVHQVGIKMASDIFEMNGWQTWFAGANLPARELVQYVRKIQPHVLALSISIYFHMPQLHNLLVLARESFSTLPIVIGGQAFRHGGKEVVADIEHVSLVKDLSELEQYIQSFQSHE